MFSFSSSLLPNLMPWEMAFVHVETRMVMPQLAKRPAACLVGLLALLDPMPHLLTESTDIEGPLHGPIAGGDAAQAVHRVNAFLVACGGRIRRTALLLSPHCPEIMTVGIFRNAWDFGPIEFTLEMMSLDEFLEGQVRA
jgi:hypothetical protein